MSSLPNKLSPSLTYHPSDLSTHFPLQQPFNLTSFFSPSLPVCLPLLPIHHLTYLPPYPPTFSIYQSDYVLLYLLTFQSTFHASYVPAFLLYIPLYLPPWLTNLPPYIPTHVLIEFFLCPHEELVADSIYFHFSLNNLCQEP